MLAQPYVLQHPHELRWCGEADGELTPTSSARAVQQMVSYSAARPFLHDPRELRSCGEADGELTPASSARVVQQMVSYSAARPFLHDPRELRSCGEADGELQRRHTIPHRLHRVLAERADVEPRAPDAS